MLLIPLLLNPTLGFVLTYTLAPHEKACFHTEVKRPFEHLSLYFSVTKGGNFDIDYEIKDPVNEVVLSGSAESNGEYAVSAKSIGEYTVCFMNTMSTVTEKVVDFEILVEHDVASYGYIKSDIEEVKKKDEKKVDPLQNVLMYVSGTCTLEITKLSRYLRSIGAKEHRNKSVVEQTEKRIFWFGVLETFVLVLLSGGQVYVIKTFFTKSARTRV